MIIEIIFLFTSLWAVKTYFFPKVDVLHFISFASKNPEFKGISKRPHELYSHQQYYWLKEGFKQSVVKTSSLDTLRNWTRQPVGINRNVNTAVAIYNESKALLQFDWTTIVSILVTIVLLVIFLWKVIHSLKSTIKALQGLSCDQQSEYDCSDYSKVRIRNNVQIKKQRPGTKKKSPKNNVQLLRTRILENLQNEIVYDEQAEPFCPPVFEHFEYQTQRKPGKKRTRKLKRQEKETIEQLVEVVDKQITDKNNKDSDLIAVTNTGCGSNSPRQENRGEEKRKRRFSRKKITYWTDVFRPIIQHH